MHQVIDIGERRAFSFQQESTRGFGVQPFDVAQAQAKSDLAAVILQRAQPGGARHVHRLHAQAVPLRVLDDRGGLIEAHGLVVQQRGRECRQVMAFQIGAGICQQREAGGMRFGKAVQRE